MDASAVISLGGVRISMLEGRIWLAVILGHMVVVIAPAAQVRARPKDLEQEQLSSRQIAHA
jgi:hypothetical protein